MDDDGSYRPPTKALEASIARMASISARPAVCCRAKRYKWVVIARDGTGLMSKANGARTIDTEGRFEGPELTLPHNDGADSVVKIGSRWWALATKQAHPPGAP